MNTNHQERHVIDNNIMNITLYSVNMQTAQYLTQEYNYSVFYFCSHNSTSNQWDGEYTFNDVIIDVPVKH